MKPLFDLLLAYQGGAAAVAETLVLVFLRVGAAMVALPGLAEQSIPARVRLGLAVALTLAVLPAVPQGSLTVPSFVAEVALGLLLGLSLRFLVFALSTAGTIAANATSLSQLFPQAGEAQPALSTLFVMAGLALAMQADLPLHLVRYFVLSYDLLPIGEWPGTGDLVAWFAHHADDSFSLAFALAMPFMIASLLYNLALGVINRAMPALMVTFVGAPALSLGGLALLAVVAPFALQVWLGTFSQFLTNPFPLP